MKSDIKTLSFLADSTAANQGTIVPGDMLRFVYNATFQCSGPPQVVTLYNRYGTSNEVIWQTLVGNVSGDIQNIALAGSDSRPLMKFKGSSYIRSQTSGQLDVGVLVNLTYADEY